MPKISLIIVLGIIVCLFISLVTLFVFNNNPSVLAPNHSSSFSSTSNLVSLSFDKLEFANTSKEQQIGLMNRQELCSKCGMLFIFPDNQPRSFWMKNTLIPLDIVFIEPDGKITNIERGQPLKESPTINSIGKAMYVLELAVDNSYNLKAGQIIDINTLLKANN
jgi:uncharacterized protein